MSDSRIHIRLPRGALRRLVGATALVAALGAFPAAALAAGGSGTEPIANNLSFPAIWSEGASLTLNGTFGSPQLQTPTVITDTAGNPLTLYLQGDATNTWQAENTTATAPVDVSQIDWGDNLESRSFSVGQQIRVETTLLENLATPMLGFTMYSASGSQSTEVFGTDGSTYDSTQATIYSSCARLTIQRLDVSRSDPYVSRITWDPSTGAWTGSGLIASPILNSGIWSSTGGGGFAAEINGSGKVDYGYNWGTSGLTAGDYRITFSLDPNCPVATLNTFITPLTSVFMTSETAGTSSADGSVFASDSGGGSVAKLDSANNLSYIDVQLGTPNYPPYVPPTPVNTAPPTVSGTTVQGHTLTTTTGSWDNSPTSYAYQWQRCDVAGNGCTNIAGATAGSYRLTSSDVAHTIRVAVTATNIDGSTAARSEASTVVVPITPVNATPPRILGTPVKGKTLVATSGTWANGPTSFTYHWQVCGQTTSSCTDIGTASGGSYTLGSAVVGQRLRVRVTATNAGGSTSATSGLTARIAAKPTAQVTLRLQFRSRDRLHLAGSVTPAHNGRHLLIQRRTRTGWKTVARPTLRGTETGGSAYGVTLAHRSPGVYRAYLAEDAAHRVSTSQTKSVRRLAHVTLQLRQLSNDRVRLSGSMTPARNGKRLVIQRRVGTSWKAVAKVRLYKAAANRSRYGITLMHPRSGDYRARFGGDAGFRPSSSSPTSLR